MVESFFIFRCLLAFRPTRRLLQLPCLEVYKARGMPRRNPDLIDVFCLYSRKTNRFEKPRYIILMAARLLSDCGWRIADFS
jgi:hypothetical protein